jgi:hypothetical protein
MADAAQIISSRALSQVGVAFKLHGRRPGVALDCVGLVGHAIEPFDPQGSVPKDYRMSGDFLTCIETYLENTELSNIPKSTLLSDGDILLTQPGKRQQHLMIRSGQGFVHAHAGLRCVVFTPDPSPWPILKIWRITGG